MNRSNLVGLMKKNGCACDILVIGGGATGLGIAVDAAARGYRVLLLEQNDFAKGTSSRSTKLVHGGVRYLAQGDIQLVVEALRERGRLKRNVPHLVKDMKFIIGNFKWWERPFYTIGLTCYDVLAGKLGLGRSLPLSARRVVEMIPSIRKKGLRGGVVYHDGQFDDARMAMTLAQTATELGGVCLNYVKLLSFKKDAKGIICGAYAHDELSDEKYNIKCKVAINATGVFVDDIMKMDAGNAEKKVRPSQGVHIVVDSRFLGGNSALMIPKTFDGRVLFGVPWHGKVVLGTTDTPLNSSSLEPRPLEEEIDFILNQAGQYLEQKPTRLDILSVFAGLRPLAAPTHSSGAEKTKEISRSHKIYTAESGLLTITGGKWTTYRQMAEEIVDKAADQVKLEKCKCPTRSMKLHGYKKNVDNSKWDYVYGSDADIINALEKEKPELAEKLHPEYTFTAAHVVWAVREELAVTVEDVLARRVRALFIDARAAIEMAPKVASIMAIELGMGKEWEVAQVRSFVELAKGYLAC